VGSGHEAAFQLGFFARAVCGLLTELRGADAEYWTKSYLILWGVMDWNLNNCQYAYYTPVEGPPRPSSGTSLTMPDPTAVWYLLSGQQAQLDLANKYIDQGLNGGEKPYGTWDAWGGAWEGRAALAVRLSPKADTTPPAAVTDLHATSAGGKVTIDWTAPANAAEYLVVWSTQPISRVYTNSATERNFWACNVVPATLRPDPGSKQSLAFGNVPVGTRIYVSIATRSADRNLSLPSNVATVVVSG